MAMCGFNEDMLNGIGQAFLGILEILTKTQDSKDPKDIIEENIKLLKEMDDRYYDTLRPTYGVNKGLEILANEFGPQSGLNQDLIKGVSLFAKGLYKQASKRASTDSISLEQSYATEIREMTHFLAILNKNNNE